VKDYIWAHTNYGLMVFNNASELMAYKNRGDKPVIHDMGMYSAEDISEVYAAKNADKKNIISGVGAAQEFAKKDAKYWRSARRKRYGRYIDTSDSERAWTLTPEQMAFHKAHPEFSFEEITGYSGKSAPIKISGRMSAMNPKKRTTINLTGLSPLERRKILNKIQHIQAPREKPLPTFGWTINADNTITILGTTYAKDEGLEAVKKFYPLDEEVITKAFKM
jgi:hypothetical protein